MKCDISVIVLTYKVDYDKLFKTLYSVIRQKNADVEVIVSDDGSQNFQPEKIEEWFNKHNFNNYFIVPVHENYGTVKNLYNAMRYCNGGYCKVISPGDFIYDENTLRYFYDYCVQNNCDIVFGNSIYYSVNGEKISLYPEKHYPKNIKPFIKCNKKRYRKNFIYYFDVILATSYFVKTEIFNKYLALEQGIAKYAEDNMYFLMMADGLDFNYLNRPIVWYEYGSGISTAGKVAWYKLIDKDITGVSELVSKRNPKFKKYELMRKKNKSPAVFILRVKKKIYNLLPRKALKNYDKEELVKILDNNSEVTNASNNV